MAVNIASSSSSTWLLPPPTVCLLPSYRISERFRRGIIFSNRAKALLYLQYGKAQISTLSVSQTKEFITDTENRDRVFLATLLGLFSNLPRPLPITCCINTYETCEVELWWPLLLADIFRWQNVQVRFCLGNFIVWSLDTCHESFIDNWITPHVVKPFIKITRFFFPFFCHIQKGKREATERWLMLTREYHLELAQVDFTGTRMT